MENNNQTKPSCCQSKTNDGLKKGLLYGLLPHAGCIAFIALAVLGATTSAAFLAPLMGTGVFYSLIALSFCFAIVSAGFYLKKNAA